MSHEIKKTNTVYKQLAWIPWVLFPLLAFGSLEYHLKKHEYQVEYGWTKVDDIAGNKNLDFMFIGTSRTACAINDKAFYETVGPHIDDPDGWFYGQNKGTGGTRLIYHYLGLRNVLEENPYQFKNTYFLIEAPAGFPEFSYWSDNWVYSTMENLVINDIRSNDVPKLLTTNTPLNDRLDMTMRYTLRDWTTYDSRERVRAEFYGWGTNLIEKSLTKVFGVKKQELPPIEDIVMGGFVSSNPEVAANADKILEHCLAQEDDYLNRPWQDWDNTILNEMVEMIRSYGGTVILYDVPQVTFLEDNVYHAPRRHDDRIAFEKWRAKKDIPLIKADFDYTDADFPDHMHLGAKKGKVFSEALGEVFIEEVLKADKE